MADSGEEPGVPALFLDQNETRRAEKNYFETGPPPYLKVWMTGAPDPYLKISSEDLVRL